MSPGMHTRYELITPELAREYLKRNTKNRPMRPARVREFVEILQRREFLKTHQGIAFEPDGKLQDGQHRLQAIADSGIPAEMAVTYNVPPEAGEVIDTHARRSDADVAKLRGLTVDNKDIATARAMIERGCNSTRAPSRIQLLEFVTSHIEAVTFANGISRSIHGISAAPVRAPIARAWYTQDRHRLGEFITCLNTGMCDGDEDKAAIVLREWAMRHTKSQGQSARNDLYGRGEYALSNFLKRKPISRTYSTEEELFPLPGEEGFPELGQDGVRLVS